MIENEGLNIMCHEQNRMLYDRRMITSINQSQLVVIYRSSNATKALGMIMQKEESLKLRRKGEMTSDNII